MEAVERLESLRNELCDGVRDPVGECGLGGGFSGGNPPRAALMVD